MAPRTLRDVYGFELNCTDEQCNIRERCAEKQAHQAAKWAKYSEKKQLPKGEKLKKLCRKGIPPQYRPWVWMSLSGAAEKQGEHMANYYDAMVHMGESTSEFAHQIDLDLARTFPANDYMSTEEGQAALRRVLLAFSAHQPQVGYCQSMNYLAAMLLLALDRSEEKAFWVLVSLIDDGGILYQGMYSQNLVGAHVEMRSLQELVVAKLPRLHQHFGKLGCDMTIIATDWFLCLFSTSLPAETTMRCWDALLSEGAKVLYRVALALLKTHEELLLAQDNAGYVLREMKLACAAMHDRDALLKVAFDGVGSMPMARIREVRSEKQAVVDVELARRGRNKAVRDAVRESDRHAPFAAEGLSSLADRIKNAYAARLSRSIEHR
ncbi:TBC1 domain family member 2A [Coccomyxa sp. Obi]|nr:TBC1 domain family member 2A [Coccomyxa sp. Obi]